MLLYRWYSLWEHATIPKFAFDKVPGHFDAPTLRYTTAVFVALSLAYLVGYWSIRRAARLTRVMMLALAAGVTSGLVLNVLLYPVGALDVFNYIIQLKLTYFYLQNPYVTAFARYPADPLSRFAFLGEVPLYYGPVWLALEGFPALLAGFSDVVRMLLALKVFNALLLILTAAILYRSQDDDRRGWLAAYCFLANPLVLFEGVGNAHNDVLVALFLVGAVAAAKRDSLFSLPLLTLSGLVKFFTFSLLPVFLAAAWTKRWGLQKIVLSLLLAVLLTGVLTIPYWAGGTMISGLRQGLTISQAIKSTSVPSLVSEYLEQINYPATSLVRAACIGILGMLILLVMWGVARGMRFERAVADTYLLFCVLVSLLYPWYLVPAIAVLALEPDVPAFAFLVTASALGLLYHPLSVWGWFNSGMAVFHVHLLQALFLLAPILVFLASEALGAGTTCRTHQRT